MKRKVLLVASVLAVGTVSTGCSMRSALPTEQGRILIDADEAGMRALSDWTTGIQTVSKMPEGAADSPYHEMRRKQEEGRTIRIQLRNGGAK